MFSFINRTIFDIPLTWDRAQFERTRVKCRQARKLIDKSINAQYEKSLKNAHLQNLDVEKNIKESDEKLRNHDKKFFLLDRFIDVAAESLPTYFEQRMEHVRQSIQEHCDAIQRIIREENEHWKEIHSAIDQNLITAEDFHVQKEKESLVPNIRTIDEVEETEENASNLVNGNTITSLVTQMIRKSQSQRQTNVSMEVEHSIPTKQERFSLVIPQIESRQLLPPTDTTYFVKLEETVTQNETNHSSCQMAAIPSQSSASLSRSQAAASPVFSQPNPPARLYFSPTLLQEEGEDQVDLEDEEEIEVPAPPVTNLLSPIDQNQSIKPKVALHRLGQTFVLNHLKSEENRQNRRSESNEQFARPTISDDVPILIETESPPDVTTTTNKRRTRAAVKTESRPTRTARATQKSVETTKRQTRKRKQSTSDENDPKSSSVALRKRKAVASSTDTEEKKKKTKTTKRKGRKPKEAEIPIREPSPLPIIDRSKHYSTRFSTRSHRLNNLTLAVLNTESDDEHRETKLRSRRAKKTEKTSRQRKCR